VTASIVDVGVVLRTTPVRESDLVVTLFTQDHGKLSAIARGARASRRRFAGTLSLLVLARWQLARGRGELWSLAGADVVREWTAVAGDPIAHAHASYVAELVTGLVPAEQTEPDALALVVELWEMLATGGPSPGALRAVELGLLDVAGQLPALERCAACSADDLDDGGVVFDPSRGGAICRRCAATSRGASVRPLSAGARAYLLAIAAAREHGVAAARDVDAKFAAVDRTAARDALVAMIVGLIGRPLRSLEYLAKLGPAVR
jgi:DNA repair protein RecO (recombination protein O)